MKDLRRYASQTQFRLIAGGVLLLFLVGDGLILIIYGAGPAAMGMLCMAAGLVPVGLILLILWGMEWVVKRANRN